MLAFFCLGARYRPWRYSAAVRSRVFGDGAAPRRTPAARPSRARTLSFVLLMGRRSPSPAFGAVFLRGGRQLFGAGESRRSSMARSSRMRSRATGSGNILARCVPGRSTMARFRRGAFPGGNPWQFFHSMHPESGLGRENRQFAARFARHASENGLALAGYARHASEMSRKSPLEDTPREDPARKGHFSLHGPLESRMARESCHPASTKRPSARNPCAADQRQTARAPATPAPPNSASRQS